MNIFQAIYTFQCQVRYQESKLMRLGSLLVSELGGRAWRNNCGMAYVGPNKTPVRFGVANPGGADLIGYTKIKITPGMVGDTIAVLTVIETKGPRTPLQKNQIAFLKAVAAAGGIAMVTKEIQDVRRLYERAGAGEKIWGMVHGKMPSPRRPKSKPID